MSERERTVHSPNLTVRYTSKVSGSARRGGEIPVICRVMDKLQFFVSMGCFTASKFHEIWCRGEAEGHIEVERESTY